MGNIFGIEGLSMKEGLLVVIEVVVEEELTGFVGIRGLVVIGNIRRVFVSKLDSW